MNILQSLVDEAQKKKKQLQNVVSQDIVKPVTHAAGNVVNAVSAHNTVQPFIDHVAAPVDRFAIKSPVGRGLQSVGLGAMQAGVETAQGISGIGDAVNHKLGLYEGPSPMSNKLTNIAKNTDITAKTEHSNPVIYHGSQVATNLLGLATGTTEIAGANAAVKASPYLAQGTKLGNAARITAKLNPAPIVERKVAGLAGTNLPGRITAKALPNIVNPGYQAANAGFTAVQTGREVAQGRKVTPAEVATNLAVGGVAFPIAAAAGGEAGQAAVQLAKNTPQIARNATKLAADTTHDIISQKPFRNISDDELMSAQKVRNSMQGGGNSMELTEKDMAHYRQVQKKLGADLNNHEAVDEMLGARRTYTTRQDYMKQPEVSQGGYARMPGGERDPAPDLHPDQKTFINDYAEMLHGMDKQTSGGQLMPDGRGGYTRITSNSQFYRQKFAETGQPPTKADYFEEARKQIEGGRAMYGASDEFAGLPMLPQAPEAPLAIPAGFEGPIRPLDDLQTQIEAAHNAGNKELAASLEAKLPDRGMNPDAVPLTPEQKATLITEARARASAEKPQITPAKPQSAIQERVGKLPRADRQNAVIVKRAEDAFVAGKLSPGVLEKVRANPTAYRERFTPSKQELQVRQNAATIKKVTNVDTPNPADVKAYIKTQVGLQDAARKANSGPGKFIKEAKSKLVDDLAPIEDTLHQRVTIENADKHLTPQLDRVLRADTIAGQFMKDNGLASVIQKVKNTDKLDQYLIAKHGPAFEREHGLGTSGRDLKADAQLVKSLAPEYEKHAAAIKEYTNKVLDKAVEYDLISPASAKALKTKYPDYVPLNRIFNDDEMTTFKGNGSGKASISSQGVVKKAVGSQRTIESPLSSLVDKTNQLIRDGERNKAAQILTGYKDMPGNPFQLRELSGKEKVGSKPVISVLVKGETKRFETTKEIADAAKSLTRQQLGLVGQVFAVPTRVLRLGATGVNVGFALANTAKDTVGAFINSEHGLRASPANPKVFVAAFKAAMNHSGKDYAELVREGAGGTSFDIARNAPRENLKTIRAQKSRTTKVAYNITHPGAMFRAIEDTIGRSEEFNRAIQYYGNKQAALAKNATESQAKAYGAHSARNNTVNFARAGEYGRVANSVLPYLNAGIQGSRIFLRTMKNRPVQTTAKLVATVFVPTATVTAWNLSDENRKAAYEDISDYEKQNNIIIMPPNPQKDPKTGKWNAIKIPVSQEIANINDIVRQGVEVSMGSGELDAKKVLGNLVGTATSISAESPRQLIGQFTPQGIKPGVESLTNQNLFTGNKIVPESKKNLPNGDQYGDYTSGTAKVLGRTLNISPYHIDNFVRTTTGGAGQNVINASDRLLAATGQIKPEEVQGRNVPDSISGRFSGAQAKSPYDQADKKLADAKKDLQKRPDFQALSVEDKASVMNKLQNDFIKIYVPPKEGEPQKPLSPRQQQLMTATGIDLSLYGKDVGGTQLKDDPQGNALLAKISSLTKEDKTNWKQQPIDKEYGDLYERTKNLIPSGMPELPKTNATLDAYASYLKSQADGKTSLEERSARKNFLKDSYASSLTSNSRDLLGTYTIADKLTAINNGSISQDEVEKAVNFDNFLIANGLSSSAKVSNTIRRTLGYGDAPKATGSGSGSGGSKRATAAEIASFKAPYDDLIQSSTKGAALARSASLKRVKTPSVTSTKAKLAKLPRAKALA